MKKRKQEVSSLEYFLHRFWFGILTFGMGLTIPDDEMDECHKLCRSAYVIFGLQNDLFSWEKESLAARRHGHDHFPNAIDVLMRQYNTGVDEGKVRCKTLMREYELDYLKTLREVEERTDISDDLKTFVEAMQFSSTGNIFCSLHCPRYHDLDRNYTRSVVTCSY
jgi:hypothetical protein